LRDLPNKLVANQIIKVTKKRVEQTLQVKDPQPLRKLFGGGLFGEFEWMPDAYDNCNTQSFLTSFQLLFINWKTKELVRWLKRKSQRSRLFWVLIILDVSDQL
jgi:hypothetical protein